MRRAYWSALAVLLFSASAARAQAPAAAATDLYHVHFVQAAPGKAAELEKAMASPPADAGKMILLRHAQGSTWDYVAIEHVGPKATIEIGPNPASATRELRAWHEDTFVAGPSWDVFARALGADAAPGGQVYIVGTYRGAPGHRAQLEQTLGKIQASAAKPDSGVVLQHVEGANWDYMVVARYDSWQALANEETDAAVAEREKKAGLARSAGVELREHVGAHSDTLATRVAVKPAAK
jgi:hypothetical protein